MSSLKVLITGAAGNIGSALASGLRGHYSELRLTDRKLPATAGGCEGIIAADLGDVLAVQELARDIDCIVHMAGIAQEDNWPTILANNVHVTVNVFEAARMAGVRRVVLASSSHVIGYYPSTQEVSTDSLPCPDSRYAVSKVFGEALARLYWDKYGISATCLRIGSFRHLPQDRRQLRTWISPRDMVGLVRSAIANTRPGFDIFYGVSANQRRLWRDDVAAIGFQAKDDAETLAPQLEATATDDWKFHGGSYCVFEPNSPERLPVPPLNHAESNATQGDIMSSKLLIATCLAFSLSQSVGAQGYPTKPVRIVVGFAPGGGSDVMARVIGARLADSLKQQVIVENRPGANGNVAAEHLAQSAPDGYSILMVSVSHAISKSLYKNLKYDFERDFQAVASVASVPNVVVVHPSLSAKTLEELLTLVRAKPGEVAYASSGSGSPEHIAAELMASMANLRMVHVPYKGGSASANDIIGGQILLGFNTMPVALPHIKSGRMRALAVTDEKRSNALPEVPTVAQSGLPGYAMSTWYGMVAPAATPKEVINLLNREINRILATTEIRERFATLGAETTGGSAEAFGIYIKAEVAKFAKVIADAKLTAD